MTINEFLEKYVDGYLLHDLRQLDQIDVAGDGNAGYPMLMTTLSGCELLGRLLTGRKKEHAFAHFWVEYLYPHEPHREEIARSVYVLARHGIAHLYVAKPGIMVTKRQPDLHLVSIHDRFWIDVTTLAADFESAYRQRAKARLLAKKGAPGLKALLDEYRKPEAAKALQELREHGRTPLPSVWQSLFVVNQSTASPSGGTFITFPNSPTVPAKP